MTAFNVTSHPRAARRLAVLSCIATVAAAAAYLLTVTTPSGQLMGELILGGRPASSDQVAGAERVLAALSRVTLAVGTATTMLIAWLQGRPRLALVAGGTVIGATLTSQTLKYLVLDRSDLLDGLFYALPNSFPSGHATVAASIAVALILVVPPLVRGPVVAIASILVAVVAVSTMIAGWHRMADAVGGVFVATTWGTGLAAILAWRRGVESVGPRSVIVGRIASGLPLTLGLTLGVVAVLGYLLALADPLDVLGDLAERGGSPALFAIGAAISAASTLVVLGSLGLAMRDIRLDPRSRKQLGSPTRDATSSAPRS